MNAQRHVLAWGIAWSLASSGCLKGYMLTGRLDASDGDASAIEASTDARDARLLDTNDGSMGTDVFDAASESNDTNDASDAADALSESVTVCRPPLELCGASCVDTSSDVNNCGFCGDSCGMDPGGTFTCQDGSCMLQCRSPFESWSGGCDLVFPLPVDPPEGAVLTAGNVTLTWSLPAGETGGTVDLCQDPQFVTNCLISGQGVNGTHLVVPGPVAGGAWFWRVGGRTTTAVQQRNPNTFEFTLPAHNDTAPQTMQAHLAQLTFASPTSGVATVAVGAPTGGQTYVFLNDENPGASSLTQAMPLTMPPGATGYGSAVTPAGDVDGDGYVDLLVGADQAAGGGTAFLHLHTFDQVYSAFAVQLMSTSASTAEFGASAATAADFNGDGYADVVVGAPNDSGGGHAYLYLGGQGANHVLAAVQAATLGSSMCSAGFGTSAALGGDYDGDRLADVLVGAPGCTAQAGGVAIVYGSSTPSAPTTIVQMGTGASFGTSVAGMGDVNGDSVPDFAVGAPADDTVFLYLGVASRTTPLAMPTAIVASTHGIGFGTAVAGGDVTGDGIPELIIGAPLEPPRGGVYVYTLSTMGSTIMATQLKHLSGTGYGFGTSVRFSGDINGDAIGDVVVGAPQSGMPALGGVAYVFYAHAAMGLVEPPDAVLTAGGPTNDGFGSSIALGSRAGVPSGG